MQWAPKAGTNMVFVLYLCVYLFISSTEQQSPWQLGPCLPYVPTYAQWLAQHLTVTQYVLNIYYRTMSKSLPTVLLASGQGSSCRCEPWDRSWGEWSEAGVDFLVESGSKRGLRPSGTASVSITSQSLLSRLHVRAAYFLCLWEPEIRLG